MAEPGLVGVPAEVEGHAEVLLRGQRGVLGIGEERQTVLHDVSDLFSL
ncbi:hypothetical protein AB7952_16910 [Streptomyces sp. PG2]